MLDASPDPTRMVPVSPDVKHILTPVDYHPIFAQ